MQRLDLKVGFQCNNRCLFCIQGDKRYFVKDKTDREVRIILKKYASTYEGVVFTGGEPTIRKELIGWIKYASQLGYKTIQIQSNGRMFSYLEYCKKLIAAGANEFSPALHGSTSKIHDSLTRVNGSFKQTVQGIINLKKLNQYVLTNTVVTKVNYKDLPRIAQLLVNLQVDQFQFAFMHINNLITQNKLLIDDIVPRYKDVMPYLKRGLDIGIKNGRTVMAEAVPYCFMKGYEKYVAEQYIPSASVIDGDLIINQYEEYRKNLGKIKGPKCQSCKFYKKCEGPWKEYPEIFGWEEFKPVLNK
ncbi:MAG: radical SAM protein [Candidatus Aenigmatarchaeota archaeon]